MPKSVKTHFRFAAFHVNFKYFDPKKVICGAKNQKKTFSTYVINCWTRRFRTVERINK